MKVHQAAGDGRRTSGSNKRFPDRPEQPIDVRKVLAASVPYGESISTKGRYVWAAYLGDERIAIAPTAVEARVKYRAVLRQRERMTARLEWPLE